jgi:hypothetical protein
MTSEPAGAYSAEVDTGLVTALRPDILIVSILLPLTGFHLGGRGFRRCRCGVKVSQAQTDWMMEAGMGELVNLKRFKKRAAREQAAKLADANRARSGRTKSERALEERRAERAEGLLDQHRIDGEDAS